MAAKTKAYTVTVATRGEHRLTGGVVVFDLEEGATVDEKDLHPEVLARLIADGIVAEKKERTR